MSAHIHSHIQHAPPPLTEDEKAAARWEDDGGPAPQFPSARHEDQWLRISAALTGRLPQLADHHDVLVTCKPGTRSGAPAAFFQVTAELELDANLFAPLDPATIDPARPGDEERYPAVWGAVVHEAAHAAHSAWTTPPELRGTAVDTAAEILEESRAERAHLQRRPADRSYLRSAVGALVMPGFTTQTPCDPWQAATAAGLLLARRDTGVLDPDEVEPLEHVLTGVLGIDTLSTLAKIWQAVHTTADTDQPGMIEHARAWCQALGTDPYEPAPSSGETAAANGRSGALSEAVGEVIVSVTAHETQAARAEQQARAAAAERARVKAEQAAQQRQSARTAEKVFTPGARPHDPRGGTVGRSPVIGTRPPGAGEKSAAGRLARALRAAAHRERTATVTASAAPPGRLNMRAALAREAQKAAGATPTARPWRHTRHHHNPDPPLRVGIAVDVSASMKEAEGPIASAAWILAKAAALTDPDSRAATVAYDHALTAITAPGRTPGHVTQFRANGRGHSLAEATDALTSGLELTRPGTARLLVVASDGIYGRTDRARAAARIAALRKAGCAVLWLAFRPGACPISGATFLELTDPAQAAAVIGNAATAALTDTRT
ncbi:VWA domain-containing protein [Streptomyces armeniacus]|uniref:VWA domain-containing protein n=2 Tax=Streptomyces armeniacus TaxID=83291 RepID=A0A345Y1W7_9ACTN|nr:VWA domain-containing protein [Streptomyces armeniacus]AXK37883.1 VWA domain-containing protein [Streptomyces armeniacus]